MLLYLVTLLAFAVVTNAVQFKSNADSEMSSDDKGLFKDINESEQDINSHDLDDQSNEQSKVKKFLDDAMETVLDPVSVIKKETDLTENITLQLEELKNEHLSLDLFMNEMDNLSSQLCRKSQEALWSYVSDINNPFKKLNMIHVTTQEDHVKNQYWEVLKHKYSDKLNDTQMKRKFRIIKERALNVKMLLTKGTEEFDVMQMIWSRATVCVYNSLTCGYESQKSMNDISAIFKESTDVDELAYYWKAFRDVTGKRVRPMFRNFINVLNNIAETENFTNAAEMWSFMYDDENFNNTVLKLWMEIKPLYEELHAYVWRKLRLHYETTMDDKPVIPAHVLGNIWAQDWQAIYHLVAPHPEDEHKLFKSHSNQTAKDFFDYVDQFYVSLGFESTRDSYEDIEAGETESCLPSSHDMCDGVNYKIKWCGERFYDVGFGLLRTARILGHVQYFKSYRTLPIVFRDGPTPAFQEALSDVVGLQIIAPDHLRSLNLSNATGPKVMMNHLLWLALEKFPLMAYGYVFDKWKWDVFSNKDMEDWNQHWWNLRVKESGISPPVPRNESDLDPASKYNVISNVQYITFLISIILEFQVLLAMCKAANHTGPLHECSVYGNEEAGSLLKKGMSLGASENWRTVLKTMTGETELSTEGILEYFKPLRSLLQEENLIVKKDAIDASAPFVFGFITILLSVVLIVIYCSKHRDLNRKVLAMCGLSKNGSLDIVNEMSDTTKTVKIETIVEEKV